MDIDAKHVVLYAIYAEYQRDIPQMERLSAKCLDMEEGVFNIALLKLQNEGLIDGLIVSPSHFWWSPKEIVKLNMCLTRAGVEYVERQVGIEPTEFELYKRNALHACVRNIFDSPGGPLSEHEKYQWPLLAWIIYGPDACVQKMTKGIEGESL